MMNKIIEYLGIEQEFLNDETIKSAINEAKVVEEKYKDQLENGVYHYSLHEDVFRFYNNRKETINIVEKLEYITVFEIKAIQ